MNLEFQSEQQESKRGRKNKIRQRENSNDPNKKDEQPTMAMRL
jgi:hypothetical protein